MTEELVQGWEDGEWVSYRETTYTYDAQGNSVAAFYRNYDEYANANLYLYYNNTESESGYYGYKYTASYINVGSASGIEPVGAESAAVKLYPNPVTSGELRIESKELKAGEPITIYNLSGAQAAVYQVAGEQTSIDISHLPSGIYMLKTGSYSKRIIKN